LQWKSFYDPVICKALQIFYVIITHFLLQFEYRGNVQPQKTERIFVLKMQFYVLSPDSCFLVEQFLNMLILDFKLCTNYIDTNKHQQGQKLRNILYHTIPTPTKCVSTNIIRHMRYSSVLENVPSFVLVLLTVHRTIAI